MEVEIEIEIETQGREQAREDSDAVHTAYLDCGCASVSLPTGSCRVCGGGSNILIFNGEWILVIMELK